MKKIKINEYWRDKFLNLHESGIEVKTVDVVLKDGRIIKDAKLVDDYSSILVNENITEKDILSLKNNALKLSLTESKFDINKLYAWECTYCFYVEFFSIKLPIYYPMKCPKCGSIMNRVK